ncbi:MAG: hypothetical protein IPI67_01895 [Myxococcales bacterium]|nr:hypothetical protein [Myxococcales bacterium]
MSVIEYYRGVHGHANVGRITRALEESGAQILAAPDATVAPFEYRIRSPRGEVLDLVCYAFTANKYKQAGRPVDEHRFQVKYGSEFKRYHDLFVDERRRKITLMFGVHHEMDLFVAVDPSVHTPTWFSMSVEFKGADLLAAKRSGWVSWERERSAARRKAEMPRLDFSTEVVSAFRPGHFLRFIEFERVATGLDPGERLLLADRIARRLDAPEPGKREKLHPLERALGLSGGELLDVLGSSFRLAAAIRGRVAEHHLGGELERTAGVSDVRHLDEDGQPDFTVRYERNLFRIECKNVLRRRNRDGYPRVDFQKTRASKGNPCSRYYRAAQFEVLAACLHPVTEQWEFNFCPTRVLAPHPNCRGHLSEKVLVSGRGWREQLPAVLETILRSRG